MQNNHFKQCEEPTCSSGKALSSSRQTFKFPASMAQKMGALPLASRRMRTSLALCCSRVRTTWGARGFSYKFLLLAREKNIWHWLYPQGVYTWPDWPVWRELARYPQGVYTWPDWLWCGEHWPGVPTRGLYLTGLAGVASTGQVYAGLLHGSSSEVGVSLMT